MANLTSQQIKDSYQSVLTTSETTSNPTTGTLQNGKGANMTALTLSGTMTANLFSGLATNLSNIRLPMARLEWTTGYFNLTDGTWNNMPFNDMPFNSSGGYSNAFNFENNGTSNASLRLDRGGVYVVITEAHFYDLYNNMDLRVGIFMSTTSATSGFSLLRAVSDYKTAETTADQIVTGVSMFNLQTVPCWLQMQVFPSSNSPYPSNTDNAPPAMNVIRIGG